MEHLLIAIDQGGTKTEVLVLTTKGELLSHTDDRDIRKYGDNFEVTRWFYINYAIQKALSILGVSLDSVDYVLAAICGADWDEDYIRLQKLLSTSLCISKEKVIIVNDCIAALRSGMKITRTKQNFAVIYAGTRFNCSLISQNGLRYTYGRYINSVDHGAFAMGMQVWSSVIDSYNGLQESTMLEKLFLQYHKVSSISELYADFTNGRREFNPTQYTSLLMKAAKLRDKIAIELVTRFAYRWTQYVIFGLPKVGLTNMSKFTLILAGGIFKNCDILLVSSIRKELINKCPNSSCSLATLEPVAGSALLLLERYYGIPLEQGIIDRFIHSSIYITLRSER